MERGEGRYRDDGRGDHRGDDRGDRRWERGRDRSGRGGDRRERHCDDRSDDRRRLSSERSSAPEDRKRKDRGSRSPSPDSAAARRRKRRRERKSQWDAPPQFAAGLSAAPQGAVSALNPMGAMMTAAQIRQARRIYIGNLPEGVTEHQISEFFDSAMNAADLVSENSKKAIAEEEKAGVQPGSLGVGHFGCISGVGINTEKSFAFVEFRFPEDATSSMGLDGIMLDGHALKVRRPKDYVPLPDNQTDSSYIPGIVSTNVRDSDHKLFVGGLPLSLTEDQAKELLSAYGPLRSFNLVRDAATNASKGFAFCEYADPEVTDVACEGLNGMIIQERYLVVRRANRHRRDHDGFQNQQVSMEALQDPQPRQILNLRVPAAAMLGALIAHNPKTQPSNVVQVMNMFSREEIYNDDMFTDVYLDVTEECSRYGELLEVTIPRPYMDERFRDRGMADDDLPDPSTDPPGVGRVFLKYGDIKEAERALHALGGRKYNGRTVITSFFDPMRLQSGRLG